MRHVDENSIKSLGFHEVEELNMAFERLLKRIIALENSTGIMLPRSAPLNPKAGAAWDDIEQGKIKVYNGSSWDEWSKD